MGFDVALNETIVFGGVHTHTNGLSPTENQTWAWANGVWTAIPTNPAPPIPIEDPLFAYDPSDRAMLLWEPLPTYQNQSLTWLFDSSDWTNVTGSQLISPPSDDWAGGIATDTSENDVVLFGGWSTDGLSADATWTFASGLWQVSRPPMSPPGLVLPVLSDDVTDHGVLLFGGTNWTNATSAVSSTATWLYAGGNWSAIPTNLSPPVGGDLNFAPTSSGDGILAWGGYFGIDNNTQIFLSNQTWLFSNDTWVNLTAEAPFPYFPSQLETGGGGPGVDDVRDGYDLSANNLSVMLGFRNDSWSLLPFSGSLNVTPDVRTGSSVNFSFDPSGGFSPIRCQWSVSGAAVANGTGCTASVDVSRVGTGVVTLVARDSDNETLTLNGSFEAYAPLTVAGVIAPGAADVGQSVSFSVNWSGGAPPILATWSFGDGTSGEGDAVAHTYDSPGNYTVQVNVTDALGGQGSSTASIDVAPSPTLSVTANLSALDVGQVVQLDLNVSGGQSPENLTVGFSDGTGNETVAVAPGEIRLNHTVVTTGRLGVTARLTDAAGENSTATGTVTVDRDPSGAIQLPSGAILAGAADAYALAVTGGVAPYHATWDWGDGTNASAGFTEDHAYSTAGNYTLTVSVRDASNFGFVVRANVTVERIPVPTPSPGVRVSTTDLWVLGGLAGAAAAGGLAVWLMRRRRTYRTTDLSPTKAP